MTKYKIDFYYQGRKHKHRLYDSKDAFEYWWEYHRKFEESAFRKGVNSGLAGLINETIDRTVGNVPSSA